MNPSVKPKQLTGKLSLYHSKIINLDYLIELFSLLACFILVFSPIFLIYFIYFNIFKIKILKISLKKSFDDYYYYLNLHQMVFNGT